MPSGRETGTSSIENLELEEMIFDIRAAEVEPLVVSTAVALAHGFFLDVEIDNGGRTRSVGGDVNELYVSAFERAGNQR